jgi:5-methyltetrahydrofolate--homocysteine methyltransferase
MAIAGQKLKEWNMDTIIKEIFQGIMDGQQKDVETKVQKALAAGLPPKTILDEGMIAAMTEVGRLFEQGEFYVPEMLIAARAMQAGLAVLKPHLKEANVATAGKVAIGTVKGDLHDIGKNLVGMMLEGAGFEILNLGTDVSPEKFVEAADSVDIIALSALLTTTMTSMKATIDALQAAGKRDHVKVIIGGAPVTEEYAQRIGADGYAPDASRAAALARSLIQKPK